MMEDKEEQLTYRRHWIGLLIPFFITTLMLLTTVAAIVILYTFEIISFTEHSSYIILYAGLFIFLTISYFFALWTFWYLDAWIVTKDKLIDSQLVSFFVHRRAEIPLRQVQDVSVRVTGVLATLFRCGNINIKTASEQGSFKLMLIKDPNVAAQNISELVKNAVRRHRNNNVNHQTTDLPPIMSDDQPMPQAHIPEIDLSHYQIDPLIIQNINQDMALQYIAIPVSRTQEGGILVALADPSDAKMNEIRNQVQVSINFVTANRSQILEAIQKHYNPGPQQ